MHIGRGRKFGLGNESLEVSRGHEDDTVRSDRHENTDQIYQPRDIRSVRIIDNVKGTEITLMPEDFAGPIFIKLSNRPSNNLFCMYALTELPDPGRPLVDPRNLAFGDSFVVVLNTQEFINRAATGIKNSGLGIECRLVEYYDREEHSGDTGPFRKPSIFNFQQEFLIAVYPGSSGPIRLSIGSLADITTTIYPLADINRIVDLK
jgi:hypothetical protein